MTIKAPFPYPGGKSRIAPVIWQAFGHVNNFVDPFMGTLAVELAAPNIPANETVNDVDGLLTNFWRAVKTKPDEAAAWADYPVSELDLHARNKWLIARRPGLTAKLEADPDWCDPKAAGWWVWGICQWIAGPWCPMDGSKPKREVPHNGDVGIFLKRPLLGKGARGVLRATPEPWRQRPALTVSNGILARPHLGRGQGVCNLGSTQGEAIAEWFNLLAERFRRTRIICGDWRRVLTHSPTTYLGMTAVLLDPPYGNSRDGDLYGSDRQGDSEETYCAVQAWAIEHGGDPLLRIALCCHDDLDMPKGWTAHRWMTAGGMSRIAGKKDGKRTRGHENRRREVVWFNPACQAHSSQTDLFDGGEP